VQLDDAGLQPIARVSGEEQQPLEPVDSAYEKLPAGLLLLFRFLFLFLGNWTLINRTCWTQDLNSENYDGEEVENFEDK
jgi:hypothetical protein